MKRSVPRLQCPRSRRPSGQGGSECPRRPRFFAALAAAGDMGLPIAATWSVPEALGYHRDDEFAAERADQAPDPEG